MTIFYILHMLGIEQKKGNDEHLCGRMIAYAKILPSPDALSGTPFDDMVKNGLLTSRAISATPRPRPKFAVPWTRTSIPS